MAIQKAKYSRSQEDFDKYAIFSTKEKIKILMQGKVQYSVYICVY